jgi:hypothetical protein
VQVLLTIRTHYLHPNNVLLLIDSVNAFNRVSRRAFLLAILDNKQFSNISQSQPSSTFPTPPSTLILSKSGTQQGDPLGPFLFALAIHKSIEKVLTMRRKNAEEEKDADEAEKGGAADEAPEADDADALLSSPFWIPMTTSTSLAQQRTSLPPSSC